jgi:hypothetical protein
MTVQPPSHALKEVVRRRPEITSEGIARSCDVEGMGEDEQ